MSAATRTLGERRHRRRIAACTAMAVVLVATVLALDVGPSPQAAPGDDATGTVRGVAWVERDGDGVRDPGEEARKGLDVSLARAADGTIAGEARTDGDGRYAFEAIPPGTYVLVAALPTGAEPAPAPTPVSGDGQTVNALTRDDAIVHSGMLEVTAGAVVEANAGILEPTAEDSTAATTDPEPQPEPESGVSPAAPSDASSTTETTEAPTTGPTETPTTTPAADTTEPSEPTTTSTTTATICATTEPTGTTTSTTETTVDDTPSSTSSTTSTTSTTTGAPSTVDATTSSTTSTTTTDPTTASSADTSTADPSTSSTTAPATTDTTALSSPAEITEPDGGCPPATTTPPSAAPAATGDLLGPADVPPATPITAVITVRVGGDRAGTTGVSGLAGVVLRLYDGGGGGPTTPVADAWATCTSDADGDCSFVVPNVVLGGNRDRRFWVVQQAAPGGWFANLSLGTGTTLNADPYRFRTGTELRAGNTYSSLVNFMVSTGNDNNQASGGIWQNSRTNPGTPSQCGLDVGLLIDVSGSVGSALPSLKTAAKTLVNSLTGTPSRMSMFTFSATAPASGANNANLDTLQSVSTPAGANVINGRIDGLSSGGTTNWDRGLAQIASSPNQFDIVVFITDGGPTVYGTGPTGPGSRTRFREVENGIFSANALKAKGTRIIAFGVGAGVSGDAAASNLIATSGPTQNSDFYQTTNYDQAAAALRLLALGNCRGSISVIKQVIPPTGTIADATPAGGWTFTAGTATPGVTVTPPSGQTSPGTGGVNFNLTFPGGTPTAPVNIAETLQPGYSVVPNGTQNATCTRLDNGQPAPGYANGATPTQFTVDGAAAYPVSCIVYNRAPSPQATLRVDKAWTVTSNGVTTNYPEGTQPVGLQAALTINGQPTPWGTTLTGLTAPSNATLAETLSPLPTGCTATPGSVTLANGTPVSNPLPYGATLVAGANTYTITNTVTCTATLSLVKEVANGSAAPTQWNLAAQLPAGAPAGAAPGPTGTTGVTAPVTPGVAYDLVESGGDPNYEQFVAANTVIPPPRTGTWSCIEVDGAGQQIPGYADGLNGGVTVGLGQNVRCTATNRTTELTLIKEVRSTHGGTAVPSNWTLTATPRQPAPPGVVAQTVTGSATGVTINVRPGVIYDFSESNVPGYTQQSFECTTPPDPAAPPESFAWVPFDSRSFEFPALTFESTLNRVFCKFVNVDSPAQVVVRKSLPTPNDDGTFALSINGTIVASGGDGVSNAAAPVAVNAGSLVTVAEVGLPPTALNSYTSTLACDSGIVPTPTPGPGLPPGTSGQFTVPPSALGTRITCTFTNTRLQTILQLEKVWSGPVDNQAAVDLSIEGLGGTFSGRSTNDGNFGNDTTAVGQVFVGETVTLAEAFDPPTRAALYQATLSCDGEPVPLTDTTGSFVVPRIAGPTITCTFINSRRFAEMTLRKTWVDGAAGDTANLSIGGAPPVPASATGVPGPETPAAVATAIVYAGTEVSLSETLAGTGSYDTTLACLPDGGALTYTTGARSGTYTVPVLPTNVVCTFTNTRQRATLTLQKTWVDGAAGDTANLSIDGGPPPAAATATATGAAGPETSPNVATATVLAGATVNLTEVLAGTGSYTSTLACGGTPITLTGLTGTYTVPAPAADVTCTFTNTRRRATLTLQKTWVDGAAGDTANLSVDGGPPPAAATATATGAAGPETSPNVATATVLAGATVNLTEVLAGTGSYASTLACGATPITLTGLTGTYTVPATPADVVCTFTNTRQRATLTLQKTWVDGAADDTANLSINGGPPVTATATGAAGALTSPNVATATVLSGATVTLTEVLAGIGSYASTLECGGTAITLTGLTGTFTVPAPATNVTCTFTNTRQRATLTLQKTWVNGAAGDNANLSINGAPPVTAPATGVLGPYTSPNTATAVVLSGSLVTLSEVLGGVGSYNSALECGGTVVPLVGLTGTYTVPATPTDVVCTFTNTRRLAVLTLQKVWVDGAAGDTADLRIEDGTPVTATATGAAGPETSPNTATASVFSGAGVTLTEVLGGIGSYTSTLDCGGTPIPLDGLTGTYIVPSPPPAADVTCTFTNTRQRATLTLQKTWVDGAAGDTANLSINGGPPPAAATATATGAAGSETSPNAATATVLSGATVTLTEVLAGAGSYASTLECGGTPITLTGLTGTFTVPAPATNVTCTFTNTRQRATLTLQKTWVDGAAGDTANLSINGGPPVTATATGAAGSETSANKANATVLSGATVSLTEVLAGVGSYTSTLDCGGPPITLTGLTGTYTVPATPTDVICTFTNTRTRATLTLQKTWINGAAGATADLSINGGPPVTAPATGVLGPYTSPDTATAVVLSGSLVTLSEVLSGAGSYNSALDCGGTPIPLVGLTGTYTVPALPADVVCTFTNTRRLAVLTLQKVWVDGAARDTATLSINGGPPPATATATATGAAGSETSPSTATDSVFSGSLVTLTEILGGVGSYTTTLDCDGTTIPLTGLRGTYTVPSPPPATDVVCTFTNTRQRAALTLQKTWVDGAANDTANLSINGGPPPASATATATGIAGSETSPNTATATVLSGATVTLTEVLAGAGSYTSTLDCGGAPIPLTGLTGNYVVPPQPADVTCTFTNTRQRATLTLQKTWVDGAANDTANLSIDGGPPPATATATATGAAGSETSPNTATATVLSGATVTLTEALAGTGSYTSALDCGGAPIPLTGLSGTYAVPAPATDVTCTFTNTRQRATLTLQKTWVDGAANDTATLSINGGPPPATAIASATGASGTETSLDRATGTVLSGAAVALSEVLGGVGAYTSTLDCGGTTIPLTGLTGTYTVPAAPTDVVCTFTNTRQRATLTLQKTWVNGAAGDSANLSINGGPPVTAFSNGDVGPYTSPDTATATVLSGSLVTLSETLAGVGSYGSLLDCGGTPVPLTGLTGTYPVPAPAADVVCTFTNTRQQATLTLQKAWVAPVDGDTADLTVTGVLGSSTVTATAPDPATTPAQLTVLSGEIALLGEVLGGATPYATELACVGNSGTLTHAPNSPNGTLAITPADAGATIACTFTNRAPRGTIVIVKNVEGIDGTFDFTGSWLAPPEFSIATSGGTGSQTTTGVLAGTYTVSEVDPSPAYDGTGLVCTDPDGGSTPAQRTSVLSGTVDLDDGETVTCTFTNTQRSTIVVVKDARPDGPTPFGFTGDLGPFTLVDDGTTSNTFTSQLVAANAAKRITETVPAGWTLDATLSTCSNASVFDDTGVTVTPGPGATVTCTFVDVAGPADVTVTKSVAGIEPGTAWGPFSIAISPVEPGVSSPQSVSGTGATPVSITFAPLQPGTTYTVSETAVPGWAAGPISCVATHADDSTESFGPTFPAGAGDRVACALTNTLQPGSLTIDKQVSSAPAPNADGTYTLAYDIAVGNVGEGPIAYTLTDHFAFAPGVVVTKVTTVNLTPGTIPTNPSFDGAANPIIASGQLAGGATDTYRVTVTANIAAVTGGPTAFDCTLQPGETGTGFLNRAQVNPTAEACAPIPYADVAITKQVDQASVDFDSDATTPARLVYTLVITNNGPDPAVDAVLDDELPPGVTFVSATPSTGSCTPNGPTAITCMVGTLAVGATVTVTVTGDLSSQADGTVTNTATVGSPTPDPNLANNVGVAATTVRRQGGIPIPITGAQVRGGLGIGGVLLVGGFLLLLVSRRRRRSTTTP